MDQSKPIEEIRENVACEKCGYNLRGLRGAIVTCPECGWQCDLVTLVKRKWTKPWWKAPGFNALVVPTIWLVAFVVAAAICELSFLLLEKGAAGAILAALLLAAGIVVWARSLAEVNRWWPGRRGVHLSMLTMVAVVLDFLLLISGLVAFLYFLGSLFEVLDAIKGNGPGAFTGRYIVTLVLSTSLMIVSFVETSRLQRWIATQCITRYLDGPADQD